MIMSSANRAGIPKTSSHMLRRSCATFAIEAGMELELVQQLLGHKYLSSTQRYLATDSEKLKMNYHKYHPFGEKYVSRI